MKVSGFGIIRGFRVFLFGGILVASCGGPVAGQLAITEAMSSGATLFGTTPIVKGPDFWELTNFGTNTVDLTHYQVSDSTRAPAIFLEPADPALLIGPGTSVIFVRTTARTPGTEAGFRARWGSCLSNNVKVRLCAIPSLNSTRDGVRLYDPTGQLVDRVDFGAARSGVTFGYDTNTWEFGAFSVQGQCGVCQAEMANEIGSPGVACGPVPLSILRQPQDLNVCAGTEAVLSIRVGGLPRPNYQWWFDGVPISRAVSA